MGGSIAQLIQCANSSVNDFLNLLGCIWSCRGYVTVNGCVGGLSKRKSPTPAGVGGGGADGR